MTGDEAHRDLSQRVPSVGASDPKDLGCATLLALECQLGSSLNPHHSTCLYQVSLRKHNSLNHWPLVTELSLQPLSPPWR